MIDYNQPHWRGAIPSMTKSEYLDALRTADRERRSRRTDTAINVIGILAVVFSLLISGAQIRSSVTTETAKRCLADLTWCERAAR